MPERRTRGTFRASVEVEAQRLAPRKIKKLTRRGPKRVTRPVKPPREEIEAKPHPSDPRKSPPYSHALSERICERIANGETATSLTHEEGMPTWAVLGRWRRENDDFAKRFQIAREQCCEYWADSVIDIVDDSTNDFVTRLSAKGQPLTVFDREHFERARLRADKRQWFASKMLRHVYGEKSEVDLRTPDGVSVGVNERNALIDAIVKLVQPKSDGETKPSGRPQERRER